MTIDLHEGYTRFELPVLNMKYDDSEDRYDSCYYEINAEIAEEY